MQSASKESFEHTTKLTFIIKSKTEQLALKDYVLVANLIRKPPETTRDTKHIFSLTTHLPLNVDSSERAKMILLK